MGHAALRARARTRWRAARRRSRELRRWRRGRRAARARRALRGGRAAGAAPPRARAVRARRRAPRPPNGAVRLLEAGGERAEAEIVGAEVLELMRDGVARRRTSRCCVRGARPARRCSRRCWRPTGSRSRGRAACRSARTRLGAGVLAGARAALPGGSRRRPADVAAHAGHGRRGSRGRRRARGARAARARSRSAREAAARRGRGRAARRARRAGRRGRGRSGGAARARSSPRRTAIWTAPHARRADVLDAEERDEARVAAELRAAAAELRALDPALLGGADRAARGARRGRGARRATTTDGVLLADPLAIRARRFRAVFVCGLQDGEFPRRPVPEPFLDDDARRALSVAARAAAAAPRGRARPRALAVLRVRLAPAGGAVPVLALVGRGGRAAGAVAVPRRRAGAVHRRAVGAARRGGCWPRSPGRRARRRRRASCARPGRGAPRARPAAAAGAGRRARAGRSSPRGGPRARAQLETFAACGVRWLVEALLHPARVTPDPEPMRRGSRAHAVLETTLRRLRERDRLGAR